MAVRVSAGFWCRMGKSLRIQPLPEHTPPPYASNNKKKCYYMGNGGLRLPLNRCYEIARTNGKIVMTQSIRETLLCLQCKVNWTDYAVFASAILLEK
ncbi:hypothetical protein VTN00DRAFT_5574 [Thermoascus crustaceus]|uniref:uncharacterized protein n=1 Tax=Thermoascus crustaceus TaxID=5088 RepID=UPI00374405A8